jgi:OOP family OmpA-OmpF porin
MALDGTGARPAPAEGALTDPVVALHPVRPEAQVAAARVTLELAGPSFILDVSDAGQESELAVLDGLLAAHVGAGASIGDRVMVGVGLPLWLGARGAAGAGAALGDLRLTAPIAVVRPGAGGEGLGVTVAPWVDAPTGAGARFLGRGGFGGGALGVAGWGFGPVRASLNLGIAGAAVEPAFGVDQRLRGLGALAFSWSVTSRFGLTTEVDVEQPLAGAASVEARVVARGRLAAGLELSAGGAVGLTRGLGTANGRMYTAIGYRFGRGPGPAVRAEPAARVARPYDVRVRALDERGAPLPDAEVTASRGPEVRQAAVVEGVATLALDPGPWNLAIAAPGRESQTRAILLEDRVLPADVEAILPARAGDARLALAFEDPEGRPVEDARVTVDGVDRGVSGPGGNLTIEGLGVGAHPVAVSAPGFVGRLPVPAEATVDAVARVVVLDRPPGAVKLRIRGPDGVVEDAVVRISGPEDRPPLPVGPTGEQDLVLSPGRWTVTVSSSGYGLQSREIVIRPEDEALVVVDVVLRAIGGEAGLGLRVIDPDGRPLEGVEVRVDGVRVGRTGNGGDLRVAGLEVGKRVIELRGPGLRPVAPREIELVPGWRDLLVGLLWNPGSVEVVARGPDGPVEDAMVRFSGPETVGPTALGADGRERFELAVGDWLAALSSSRFGLQSRELVVRPEDTTLVVVDATLRAAEAGDASLMVLVRDPDGAPVEGAVVLVDGMVVGETGSAGSLRLEGLQPGRRSVSVRAALCEEGTLPGLELRPGPNEAVARLAWSPGRVRVRAVGPDGAPVDALVRFFGGASEPPVALGPDGDRLFSLPPGRWTAVLSSAEYGFAQADIVVKPDDRGVADVTLVLGPPGTETATLLAEVVDTTGAPVEGARLVLNGDERDLGGGGALLDALPVGSTPASVRADGYTPLDVPALTLLPGGQERRFTLAAISRRLRVAVRDAEGRPVEAAVRLDGPAPIAPTVARGGLAELSVRPGDWQVLVSADGHGATRQRLRVPAGEGVMDLSITLGSAQVELTATAIRLDQQVRFRFDEATLSEASFPVLDALAATLLADPAERRLEIQGHTDAVGTEGYNVALSQRRADAVRDHLIARGVPRERLVAVGYGTSRPIAPNDSEADRSLNRRVQFAFVD